MRTGVGISNRRAGEGRLLVAFNETSSVLKIVCGAETLVFQAYCYGIIRVSQPTRLPTVQKGSVFSG